MRERQLPNATEVLEDGQWAGQPAFVIGGGPSLRDFDWRCLDGLNTIGTNMAFRHRPKIAYLTDASLIARLEDDKASGWYQRSPEMLTLIYVGSKGQWESHKIKLERCHWMNVDLGGRPVWGKTLAQGLAPMNNSGLLAINLADILGADPIYLLGFDMNGEGGQTAHWHDYYREKPLHRNDVYGQFCRNFEHHVPEHVQRKTWNCCPDSRLTVFRKMPLEELMAIARGIQSEMRTNT